MKKQQLSQNKIRSEGEPVKEAVLPGGNRDLLSALGGGKTMPTQVRTTMEETLGTGLSGVKLYESPVVSDYGARAAASGNHVAFAPGELNYSTSEGRELLGHELSHVAAQKRGQVTGSGFLNDPALERKADTDGKAVAAAFDSVSGGILTPMSGGMNLSAAGPVQAKKKSKGQRLEEGYGELDDTGKVETLQNLAIISSNDNSMDESESEAYFSMLKRDGSSLLPEILRQQVASAKLLNGIQYDEGMSEDERLGRSQFSPEADRFQSISSIMKDMSFGDERGGEQNVLEFARLTREMKESNPDDYAAIIQAQKTVMQDGHKNSFFQQNPNARDEMVDETQQRAFDLNKNWQRPKKKSFFARLFGR